MLDYEWGNPSNLMLTGNEDPSATSSDQNHHRQIFDHYPSHHPMLPENYLSTPTDNNVDFSHQQNHFSSQVHHSFFDPRAYHHGASSSSYPPPQPPQQLSLDQGLFLVPKSEDFVGSRIGLNLGGRTYFSSSEDDFVSRLYRRSRTTEPATSNSPRCQAEGCNADLSQAKHYHRRHKVCDFHSKAATVIAAGLTQRFCQQCSRFSKSLLTQLQPEGISVHLINSPPIFFLLINFN